MALNRLSFWYRQYLYLQEVLVTKKDIHLIVEGSLRVVDDLITLDELNEPVLLFNLKERYAQDKIYVCNHVCAD